jgi:sulfur-oxidizing protein SoxB
VGGLEYTCDPNAKIGSRIQDMRLNDKPLDAGKKYKVAGWAPVAEGATGEPVWDVVARYLRDKKTITPRKLNQPKLVGMRSNVGIA